MLQYFLRLDKNYKILFYDQKIDGKFFFNTNVVLFLYKYVIQK